MKQFAISLLLLCFYACAQAEVVVIAHPNASSNQLSREQVANIFLGRTNTLPEGTAVVAFEQLESNKSFAEFHQLVTGKSIIQFKAYWAKMVFAGKASPPRELNADEVKNVVSKNINAIGYIDRSMVDNSVKIVFPAIEK